MQLLVMKCAKRNGKFIAHLAAEGAGLGKPKMMRLSGIAATDSAGLRCNETQVVPIARPFGLGDRQGALVDFGLEDDFFASNWAFGGRQMNGKMGDSRFGLRRRFWLSCRGVFPVCR